MTEPSIEAQIHEVERRRCAALIANDLDALAAMVTDDLVHVHTTGRIEDKQAWLAGLRDRLAFIEINRQDLLVRAYGDVAVATGYLEQLIRIKPSGEERWLKMRAVQVWVRRADRWQQSTFQGTNVS